MDSSTILQKLEGKLGQSSSVGEAFAMLGGLVISLVLNAVLWAGLYTLIVFRFSYGLYRYSSYHTSSSLGAMAFDVPTCIVVVAIGTLVSVLLSKAHRATALGASLGAARDSLTWFSTGSGEMAGGCLGSFLDFLGGNILACLSYFFRVPPLSRNQYVVATGIVSCCLQQPGVGLDVVHDSILPNHPELTEADFERALMVLRGKDVVEGQSYLNLSPDFLQELRA